MKVYKIEYVILKQKKRFSEIKEGEFFSNGTHLYKKILLGDLKHFEIKNVNSFNVLHGGLNCFHDDEEMNTVILEN